MVLKSCVPRPAPLWEHVIEDVPTSYIKHVLVVYVTSESINLMDIVMTWYCYLDFIHLPSSFLFFFFFPNSKSTVHFLDTLRNGTVRKSNAIGFAFSRYRVKCRGIAVVTDMI